MQEKTKKVANSLINRYRDFKIRVPAFRPSLPEQTARPTWRPNGEETKAVGFLLWWPMTIIDGCSRTALNFSFSNIERTALTALQQRVPYPYLAKSLFHIWNETQDTKLFQWRFLRTFLSLIAFTCHQSEPAWLLPASTLPCTKVLPWSLRIKLESPNAPWCLSHPTCLASSLDSILAALQYRNFVEILKQGYLMYAMNTLMYWYTIPRHSCVIHMT